MLSSTLRRGLAKYRAGLGLDAVDQRVEHFDTQFFRWAEDLDHDFLGE
jgi:hypothetical protein